MQSGEKSHPDTFWKGSVAARGKQQKPYILELQKLAIIIHAYILNKDENRTLQKTQEEESSFSKRFQ